nr:uncharacterized protein LOC117864031 [Setaria viridis]
MGPAPRRTPVVRDVADAQDDGGAPSPAMDASLAAPSSQTSGRHGALFLRGCFQFLFHLFLESSTSTQHSTMILSSSSSSMCCVGSAWRQSGETWLTRSQRKMQSSATKSCRHTAHSAGILIPASPALASCRPRMASLEAATRAHLTLRLDSGESGWEVR